MTPEWENAVAFRCSACKEHAIVPQDSDEAEAGECRACNSVPTLEDAPAELATDGGRS